MRGMLRGFDHQTTRFFSEASGHRRELPLTSQYTPLGVTKRCATRGTVHSCGGGAPVFLASSSCFCWSRIHTASSSRS